LWNMWGHEGTPWSRRITGADGPHKLRLEIPCHQRGRSRSLFQRILETLQYIPYYAILSHRWEQAEVTFQDLKDGTAPKKAGYAKIMGFCAKAFSDGWTYVWIDSCCIDKSSSAELPEAINLMFKWYENAQVCYAYLSDVRSSFAWLHSVKVCGSPEAGLSRSLLRRRP
jgi:hypothetical protein